MKKLIYGVLAITLIGGAFYACNKENNNQRSGNIISMQDDEREFIKALEEKIAVIKKNHVPSKNSSIDPTYSNNQFDYIGVNHNVQLGQIHNHPNFTKDAQVTLQVFNSVHLSNTGKPIITDINAALSSTSEYFEAVVENGEVSETWINSLSIPNLEKQTLNLYFATMYGTNDIQLRVNLSKGMELAVKNSFLHSSASKERLLTTFAIFRHSTVYWSTFDGYAGLSPLSEAIDALVAEWCMDGTISSPSGYDISCPGVANGIGAAVSAIFDVVHRM